MTASQLLYDVYRAYRGKPDSRTPVWGSDKANVALAIANRKIQEWATDPRNKWNSLFEITALATTVDANTPTATYNLATNFFQPSDYVKIVKTDSSYVEYPIVKAQQRNNPSYQAVYIHGSNPKKLTFAQTIDTGLHGGTIYVPGYFTPSDLTVEADVVPVDDPRWLVYITASELARNDAAKDDQFPTLVGMANDLYRKMSDANNDMGYAQPNVVENFMPQVSIDTDDWTS
jgi:hypothetical protein